MAELYKMLTRYLLVYNANYEASKRAPLVHGGDTGPGFMDRIKAMVGLGGSPATGGGPSVPSSSALAPSVPAPAGGAAPSALSLAGKGKGVPSPTGGSAPSALSLAGRGKGVPSPTGGSAPSALSLAGRGRGVPAPTGGSAPSALSLAGRGRGVPAPTGGGGFSTLSPTPSVHGSSSREEVVWVPDEEERPARGPDFWGIGGILAARADHRKLLLELEEAKLELQRRDLASMEHTRNRPSTYLSESFLEDVYCYNNYHDCGYSFRTLKIYGTTLTEVGSDSYTFSYYVDVFKSVTGASQKYTFRIDVKNSTQSDVVLSRTMRRRDADLVCIEDYKAVCDFLPHIDPVAVVSVDTYGELKHLLQP